MGFVDTYSIFLVIFSGSNALIRPAHLDLCKSSGRFFLPYARRGIQSLPQVATIALQTKCPSGQAILTVHEKEEAEC